MNDATQLAADNSANDSAPDRATPQARPLRAWPVILLLVGMVVARLIPSLIQDGPAMIWMSAAFGPALCGVLVLLWWVLASRARWSERIVGFVGVVVALIATEKDRCCCWKTRACCW